jgi:polysaccharide export outer membrane protein
MFPLRTLIMRLGALGVLLLAGSALAAGDDVSGYGIQPGDVLGISVWREPDLEREVLVRPDGGISFPLVGNLEARGKTVSALTAELTKRLGRFIPDPEVSVSVNQITGNRIYVLGRVNSPGEFAVMRPVSVMQALSMAGGLTPYAEREDIKVLRGTGDAQQSISFDYNAVERGESLGQNILLQPGDVVVVP